MDRRLDEWNEMNGWINEWEDRLMDGWRNAWRNK